MLIKHGELTPQKTDFLISDNERARVCGARKAMASRVEAYSNVSNY